MTFVTNVPCARETETILPPLFTFVRSLTSRAQGTSRTNLAAAERSMMATELEHDWTATHPKVWRRQKPVANQDLFCMFFCRGAEKVWIAPILGHNATK